MAVADELQKLKELHASGGLTDAEHSAAKAKVLGTSAGTVTQLAPAPSAASKVVRGIAIAGVAILALIVVLVIVGRGVGLAAHSGPLASPLALLAPTEVVVDEDLVITAGGGAQMRGFSLAMNAPVRVEVVGVKDADKGFDVYLIPPSEWENIKSRKQFKDFPQFSSPKVSRMSKTGTLSAGSYGLVVRNSYNLLFGMTVHLKITANPK